MLCKFVQEIVIIPEYYLTNARGFAGLEGVQRLYNVDVMALVSYDQITRYDDNRLSLGYLTIVASPPQRISFWSISTRR